MSRVGQLLREAAVYVEGGWCQGWHSEWDGEDDSGPPDRVCALGAIDRAGVRYTALERSIAGDALKVYGINDPIASIADWNDKPERTQADVVAALNLAAVIHDEHIAAIYRIGEPEPEPQPEPVMA